MASSSPKIKKKLVLLMIFAGALILLLALRLAQVMLVDGPDLQAKALTQWTRRSSLQAQRGRIMDRNGLVLAQTGTAYRVLVNPQAIAEEDRVRIAVEVSDVLDLDYEYVFTRVSDTSRKQVQLKRQVESAVVDELTALQLGSGISFTTDKKRYYPFGQLFAQIIGFTGIDGEGQTGVEAEYDTYLAGTDGLLVTEVDRKGNALSYGEETYLAPTDGYDMTLTVDSVVQSYLENYVEQCQSVNRGISTTGLIMNPNTGEILAMATYPSFDLNEPPRDRVTELMSMSRNRAVTDTFEPGSIFKVVTLAAALDSGAVTEDSTFECNGYRTFRLERVRCWKTGGHGSQTLEEAAQNSCNCAFMDMAAAMGVNTFYDYIYAFGFEESTECGLPQEDTGSVIHRKYIRESDLARVAFGQTMTCTPIQICNAVSAAVNGGVLMKPFLVEGIYGTDGTEIVKNEPQQLRRVIKTDTSAAVRRILQSVVDKGSGSNAAIEGYSVGGKTGTAQKYDDDGVASRTQLVASFVGFLPVDSPQLVMVLTVDEPQVPVVYGSTVAAPWVQKTFAELVQYYGIQPDRIGETEDMVEVPNVLGMTGEEAHYALVRREFTCDIVEGELTAQVITQIPEAGARARSGSPVLLYTSMTTYNDEGTYLEQVVVPNLIGKRRQDASDVLGRLGLTINFDKTCCTGQIDTQSIAEGEKVAPGTEIFVTFPTPTPSPLPDETPGATPTPQVNE